MAHGTWDCARNEERTGLLLMDLAAGRLSGEDARLAAKHVSSCAACATRLAEYRRLNASLGILPARVAVSDEFDARVQARIAAESRSWTAWLQAGLDRLDWLVSPLPLRPGQTAALAGACLAMTLFFAVPVWKSQPAPPAVATVETVDLDQVERVLEDMEMLQVLNDGEPGSPDGSSEI